MLSFRTGILLAFSAAVLIRPDSAFGGGEEFGDYFEDRTIRVDYYHTGDAISELVTLDHVYRYGTWAGSLKNLVDDRDYGAYYYKIFDDATGKLVFSRGFDSYFKEYQTSDPAGEGIKKTFMETALIPSPKNKVIFTLARKQKEGDFKEVFRSVIDPGDVNIIDGEFADKTVEVIKILDNGSPHVKIDIAFIAEGYTRDDRSKFEADLGRFTEVFFRSEPCSSFKDHFNIYGVFKPSAESGVDEPRHGSFKQTALGATFNSLGSERYVLTEDNRALRDIAAHVPYDALYIMVNHKRYGGGGIYNFYCTFTADNQWSEYLMVHEFGHSFFGLADEYYTSSVAYDDFYPKGFEPSEPNITALLDPRHVKWAHLIEPGIDVPTPWEKAEYDKADIAWQKTRQELNDRIAKLRKNGAPEKEVQEAEDNTTGSTACTRTNARVSRQSRFAGRVGVYEGAGYASTGLYRPMIDCIMFSKGSEGFCAVCREAMIKMIEWYSE